MPRLKRTIKLRGGPSNGSTVPRLEDIVWPKCMGAAPTKLMVRAFTQAAMTFPIGFWAGLGRHSPASYIQAQRSNAGVAGQCHIPFRNHRRVASGSRHCHHCMAAHV